jgi:transposase
MKKTETMPVINAYAAAIDVGSREHYTAVGQHDGDVVKFGVYSSDHQKMIEHFKEHKITTIAMESTGSYWPTLYSALQEAGFEVLLVHGGQSKNLKAKSDVQDCQWLQKLHSIGMLRGSFLPSKDVEKVKVLSRHRASLIEDASRYTNRMQKALRLMNLRLDVAISDITGKSGIRIIEAILEGERSGEALAKLADKRVKKTRAEIADALNGQWREEYLITLNDCYQIYKTVQSKIASSTEQIRQLLEEQNKLSTQLELDKKEPDQPKLAKKQMTGKNQPDMNLAKLSYEYYGVDLFAIPSVSYSTVLTLISEVGHDIDKFPTEKHWINWLRLAPNNKVSGGKVISNRTPKGKNKMALALRNAANTISRTKEGYLGAFFKRIAYKKGRGAAITATARKMGVIIYKMITQRKEYIPPNSTAYSDKVKRTIIANTKKNFRRWV